MFPDSPSPQQPTTFHLASHDVLSCILCLDYSPAFNTPAILSALLFLLPLSITAIRHTMYPPRLDLVSCPYKESPALIFHPHPHEVSDFFLYS